MEFVSISLVGGFSLDHPVYIYNHKLQPELRNLNSYVQDTTDFIKKISKIKPLPKGAHLVTMDVRSLYTSILNEEGLQAVEQTLMESNR